MNNNYEIKSIGESKVLVTPEMAKQWLKKNTFNRRVKPQIVNQYAKMMNAGEWGDCIDPICFSKEDILLNGQHRLLAIVKSGESIKFNVYKDVEKSSYMDSGIKRSAADNCNLVYDIPNDTRLFAIIKLVDGVKFNSKGVMTHSTISRFYNKYEKELIFTRKLFSRNKTMISRAPIQSAIFLARCNNVSEYELEKIVRILYTGYSEDLKGTAIIALREYLINRGNVGGGAKVNNEILRRAQWSINKYIEGYGARQSRLPENFIYEIPEMEK